MLISCQEITILSSFIQFYKFFENIDTCQRSQQVIIVGIDFDVKFDEHIEQIGNFFDPQSVFGNRGESSSG